MERPIANQPTPSQVSGRLATWHRLMEEAGLTYEALQMPIDDPEMRRQLVSFWMSGGFEPTSSQKRARGIMGRNFFDVEEAVKHFGVNPTRQQLAVLSEIPFSEAVLEQSKDTHVLVAVFPLSILEIRGKVAELLYDQSWCNKESFAKERGEASWQLLARAPVVNSTSKSWQEQQALLGKGDEVPSARVMVYTIVGHFLATGERLFERIYVRTSSVVSDGGRVSVGLFDQSGLGVDRYYGGDLRFARLGVSSSVKFAED